RLAGGALALGVHLPGGVEGEQAGLVDFHPGDGDRLLDELLVGQRAAEGVAFVGAAAHHLVGALGGPDRPHAVVDAAGAEAVLGDREAAAPLAQEVLPRDPAAFVADLAV